MKNLFSYSKFATVITVALFIIRLIMDALVEQVWHIEGNYFAISSYSLIGLFQWLVIATFFGLMLCESKDNSNFKAPAILGLTFSILLIFALFLRFPFSSAFPSNLIYLIIYGGLSIAYILLSKLIPNKLVKTLCILTGIFLVSTPLFLLVVQGILHIYDLWIHTILSIIGYCYGIALIAFYFLFPKSFEKATSTISARTAYLIAALILLSLSGYLFFSAPYAILDEYGNLKPFEDWFYVQTEISLFKYYTQGHLFRTLFDAMAEDWLLNIVIARKISFWLSLIASLSCLTAFFYNRIKLSKNVEKVEG